MNPNLLKREQISNYIDSLVCVHQTVSLFDDFVSVRTSFDSGLIREIAYIGVNGSNVTIAPVIDNVQNLMLKSLYQIVYDNVIQSDDVGALYPIIIGLILDMPGDGEENSFAQFAQDIYDALNP
ncbi:MAG TPA: hypothetical protein PKC68_04485 [Alphaproteobacteria bacterium]|nr:hypothetical protein [Alphaproteobacteria bacterium]